MRVFRSLVMRLVVFKALSRSCNICCMQILHKGVINIDELSNKTVQHFPIGAIREQLDYVTLSIKKLLSNFIAQNTKNCQCEAFTVLLYLYTMHV